MQLEQIIVAAERLGDDLRTFKKRLRDQYSAASKQVTAANIRSEGAALEETWLVNLANDNEVVQSVDSGVIANLNVHFQRVLRFTEHATLRARYDAEVAAILKDFTASVVLPLKQLRGKAVPTAPVVRPPNRQVKSAFIGQSFDKNDESINRRVSEVLTALGMSIVTGERPTAETISKKVRGGIEAQDIFVGIFTRRDKLSGKEEWATSAWIIDEKAYAVGRNKPLILLKEKGVSSIGGIQGDYQYIEFSRDNLDQLLVEIVQLFEVEIRRLRGND